MPFDVFATYNFKMGHTIFFFAFCDRGRGAS